MSNLPQLYPDEYSNKRFWSYVDVRGEDDCWNWLGSKTAGYGRFGFMGKYKLAHRIVVFGPLTKSHLLALHNCDNPSCVNPKHLRAGTYKDNMEDLSKRGKSLFSVR